MSVTGNVVLIRGKPASGKSAGLRNIENPDGVLFANCESGKELPFPAKFRSTTIIDPYTIWELFERAEKSKKIHTIIIDTMTMMMDMLSVCGHIVIVARNGKEAIELALSNQPDLILMDIRMPIMDVLDATRRLRSLPQFRDTPIIALTASVGESTRDRCVEAGCTEHLSKPIQSNILFKTLRHYFSSNLTR